MNLEKVPEVFRWIQWLSFVSYSNKALVQNEFDENVKFTCSAGQACYSNGLQVVSAFGLGTPSLWICVIINLSLAMTFLIIGYFQFNRTSRPLMKLRSEPVLAPLPEVVVDAPEHVE